MGNLFYSLVHNNYHWLAVSYNKAQRSAVYAVAKYSVTFKGTKNLTTLLWMPNLKGKVGYGIYSML